ncbi:MAG: tautomerase family protein [Clostridiales bacterium]|nr:tautomerase family protein [Clostridiales bacterium]
MPLVRIEILKGKDSGYKKNLLDSVHKALVLSLGIEDWDRFQRLYELEEDNFERSFKSERFTIIEITLFPGRTKEQKAALFHSITEELQKSPGISAEDVFIILQEPPNENWGLAGRQRN